jgi:hypothetical protein
MKRTLLLVLLLTLTAAHAEPVDSDSGLAGFFKATISILKGGPAIWETIGKMQAGNTLQAVSSGATDVVVQKRLLKSDILRGAIKDPQDLNTRIYSLEAKIDELRNSLVRFSQEIDSTSHNEANSIRAMAETELSEKNVYLIEAMKVWSPDEADKKKAAAQVDLAIVCSKQVSIASKCLWDSFQSGHRSSDRACKDKSIEKSAATCQDEQAAVAKTQTK